MMKLANCKIMQGTVFLFALLLTACGGGTTGDGDNTPGNPAPAVTLISPANNATGVALNSAITATFRAPVNLSTVSPATFTLSNGITGNVSCDGMIATFTPSPTSPLTSGTTYTATITTGVKSAAGTAMASPYTWTFTTGTAMDTIPPTVTGTNPATDATAVATNAKITATFSEDMNASTVILSDNFTLKNSTTNENVLGKLEYSGTTVTFTPSSALANSTLYVASVTKGVTDMAGNAIASPYTWSFTTGAATDTAPPTVSSTSPAGGGTDIATNAAITATFSEDMNVSTVTAPGNFTLSAGSTTVPGTVTYNNRIATFSPTSGTLANGTLYTATITTDVNDAAGNAMASASTWSFTTVGGVTAPAITTQPQGTAVVTGQTATFSVVATGSAPLSYQWQKDGAAIAGATSSSYTTPATILADSGAQFTVVVGNSAGNVTSNAAVLTVHDVLPVQNGSRYLSGSILSPITPTVATRLKAVFAQGKQSGLKDNVFFKVGDSISAGNDYLTQFAYPAFNSATMHFWDNAHDLGNYQSLKGAHDYFMTGRIGSDNPYQRTTVAAASGMTAKWALGILSGQTDYPLQAELRASQGAYSIIMFGTNNFREWNPPANDSKDAATYQEIVENTFKMLDYCIANGSVPILTAPPPNPTDATTLTRSRMTSRLLRASAQGRQIPFIDYYASLLDLPNYGLQAGDIHPNAMAYNRFAFLTTEGLQFGYNMRNLVSLQSLDRMYRLLVLNEAAPDAETGGLQGSGSAADPFVIDGLDFSDYQTPANGATAAYYKLTVANGEAWQFAGAGQSAAVSGIEIRDGQGALVKTSSLGVLAQTLAAGTYTIKVNFPAGVGGFVFAALANSGR